MKKATPKKQQRGKTFPGFSPVAKIIWLVMILFLWGVIIPASASSHPAGNVTLSYDKTNNTLSVTIRHPSAMPDWHYIKTVSIEKNKENPIDTSYEIQPEDKFTYTYTIAAVSGDTLTVTTTCSLYGTTAAHITIP